jgi:hypothetical protein
MENDPFLHRGMERLQQHVHSWEMPNTECKPNLGVLDYTYCSTFHHGSNRMPAQRESSSTCPVLVIFASVSSSEPTAQHFSNKSNEWMNEWVVALAVIEFLRMASKWEFWCSFPRRISCCARASFLPSFYPSFLPFFLPSFRPSIDPSFLPPSFPSFFPSSLPPSSLPSFLSFPSQYWRLNSGPHTC